MPMVPTDASRAAPSRDRPWLGCALALLAPAFAAPACRCGGAGEERAYEVGAPLDDMPQSKPGALAGFVPAPAPVFLIADRPATLLQQIRASPRLRPLADPNVLQDFALSSAGATARALRQRLSELSRLPAAVDAAALLDGPVALAARTGPGDPDLLLLKRLSPAASASWRAAQMLQAVRPSHTEVRVERYRGLPLRKVLVDERRRLTYAVLKDLLVAGTSDAWVKQSLDLALGAAGPGARTAQDQAAVAAALSSGASAALVAVVDAEAVRAEPGKPGLAALALSQIAWLRLTVEPAGALRLAAARTLALSPAARGASALERFLPRRVSGALSRRLDLSRALAELLGDAAPAGAGAKEALALRKAILDTLAPKLGDELFWYSEGVELDDGRPVARHVFGLRLKDPAGFATSFAALEPALLGVPIVVERDGGRAVTCSGEGGSLCFALADDVLLLTNRASDLRAALAGAGRGRGADELKAPAGADVLLVDGSGLSAALGEVADALLGPPGLDAAATHRRPEPLLGALRTLGSLSAVLRPKGPLLLEGEITAR